MAGLAGPVLGLVSSHASQSFGEGGRPSNEATGQTEFALKFAADSANEGLKRTLVEERKRAETFSAEEKWDEAMQSFGAMAHAAVELGDRSSEAVAVLRMADCLSKPENVDVDLICGMYRYAGDAAQEVGDVNTRFSALIGCAQVRQSCGMLERAEGLWQAALDLALSSEISEHVSFARSKLAMTLLQDPAESKMDIVDESKHDVGHAYRSKEAGSVHLHGGSSNNVEKALKLLSEVVQDLPETAPPSEQAVARMNLVSVLKRQQGVLSKRKIEKELVSALECLLTAGGDPVLQKSIEFELLEHYEDNAWLLDSNKEAQQRYSRLQAKYNAEVKTDEQLVADKGKLSDPEQRFAVERALWAEEKLKALKAFNEGGESDSESDDDGAMACPKEAGWQK